jgi:hypothetical protein
MVAFGLGDTEAGGAAVTVDEGAEPEAMLVAGSVADGDRQRAQAETRGYIAGFDGGGREGCCGQQQAGRQEHPAHARLLWGMVAASQRCCERRV